jgi:hypothetical protein
VIFTNPLKSNSVSWLRFRSGLLHLINYFSLVLPFSFSKLSAAYVPSKFLQTSVNTHKHPLNSFRSFSFMPGFRLLASASHSFSSSIAFASLCLLLVTLRLRFFKLRRDLHQHLNKSSQSLQHLLNYGFDTASQLTSARFSLHFAWSLVNYLPPSLLQVPSDLH